MRTFNEHLEYSLVEREILDLCILIAEENLDVDQIALGSMEYLLIEQAAAAAPPQPGIGERIAGGLGRMVRGVGDWWGKVKAAYQGGTEGDPYQVVDQQMRPLLQSLRQLNIDPEQVRNAIYQNVAQQQQQLQAQGAAQPAAQGAAPQQPAAQAGVTPQQPAAQGAAQAGTEMGIAPTAAQEAEKAAQKAAEKKREAEAEKQQQQQYAATGRGGMYR